MLSDRRRRRIWIGQLSIAVGVIIVLGSGAQLVLSDDPELAQQALRNVVLGSGIVLLWISMLSRRPRVSSISLGASLVLVVGHFFLW